MRRARHAASLTGALLVTALLATSCSHTASLAERRREYDAWKKDSARILTSGLNPADLSSCDGSADAFKRARQTYVEPPSALRDTYQKLLDAEQEGLQLCQDHNLRAEPPVQARIAELQREMTRLKAPIEHELYATRP